jgi:hypothetical protein
MRKDFVLYGNYQEFSHSKDCFEYEYLSSIMQLFGRHGGNLYLKGTYYNNGLYSNEKVREKLILICKIGDISIIAEGE